MKPAEEVIFSSDEMSVEEDTGSELTEKNHIA